jgi:hypothetical protein
MYWFLWVFQILDWLANFKGESGVFPAIFLVLTEYSTLYL